MLCQQKTRLESIAGADHIVPEKCTHLRILSSVLDTMVGEKNTEASIFLESGLLSQFCHQQQSGAESKSLSLSVP